MIHSSFFAAFILSALSILFMTGRARADVPVTGLQAEYRDGQVFLTWDEGDTPQGTTFNAYGSAQPITQATLSRASKLAHHIEAHSARDWWEDPASFFGDREHAPPVGFVIVSGGPRLDPGRGLFVHTVTREDEGSHYYAITCSDPKGTEDTTIVPGANATTSAVTQRVAPTQAIWIAESPAPAAGSAKGKALLLSLHGRGGVITDNQYVAFGGPKLGWREGLAFKFRVTDLGEIIGVQPTDRSWVNRPVRESPDARDHVPAVATFWYGYNSHIYDAALMATGVPTNYVEERLLWIIGWAQRRLGTDPNRTYCKGGSMGGSGAISMALHHPDAFAAIHAQVPVVSYTEPGKGSAVRLETVCGPLGANPKTNEGIPILDRMNGALLAQTTNEDLPFIYLVNGRQDASIPWVNNPPFYRALNDSRHGFACYWDNGTHPTAAQDAPDDVQAWGQSQTLLRLRRDESYPAFSNCSTNRDPGNGDPADGDIVGWMNRGLGWRDMGDTAERYAITITAAYPGIEYPVTVDVTPRRLQRFRVRPGEEVQVSIDDSPRQAMTADGNGLVTVRAVRIPSGEGVRVEIAR